MHAGELPDAPAGGKGWGKVGKRDMNSRQKGYVYESGKIVTDLLEAKSEDRSLSWEGELSLNFKPIFGLCQAA